MLQLTSPSSLLRVLGAAYVYALHQLGPWNLGMELHPWMILPMCLLNILWLHVPALWSGRVNLQLCVAHLEGTVQYFAILLLIVVYWGESLALSTQAALFLAWHVWQNLSSDWLPSPMLMQLTLCLNFALFVPAVWMHSSTEASSPDFICIHLACDMALMAFQCCIRIYAALFMGEA